jgi:hypothetical protein
MPIDSPSTHIHIFNLFLSLKYENHDFEIGSLTRNSQPIGQLHM